MSKYTDTGKEDAILGSSGNLFAKFSFESELLSPTHAKAVQAWGGRARHTSATVSHLQRTVDELIYLVYKREEQVGVVLEWNTRSKHARDAVIDVAMAQQRLCERVLAAAAKAGGTASKDLMTLQSKLAELSSRWRAAESQLRASDAQCQDVELLFHRQGEVLLNQAAVLEAGRLDMSGAQPPLPIPREGSLGGARSPSPMGWDMDSLASSLSTNDRQLSNDNLATSLGATSNNMYNTGALSATGAAASTTGGLSTTRGLGSSQDLTEFMQRGQAGKSRQLEGECARLRAALEVAEGKLREHGRQLAEAVADTRERAVDAVQEAVTLQATENARRTAKLRARLEKVEAENAELVEKCSRAHTTLKELQTRFYTNLLQAGSRLQVFDKNGKAKWRLVRIGRVGTPPFLEWSKVDKSANFNKVMPLDGVKIEDYIGNQIILRGPTQSVTLGMESRSSKHEWERALRYLLENCWQGLNI